MQSTYNNLTGYRLRVIELSREIVRKRFEIAMGKWAETRLPGFLLSKSHEMAVQIDG